MGSKVCGCVAHWGARGEACLAVRESLSLRSVEGNMVVRVVGSMTCYDLCSLVVFVNQFVCVVWLQTRVRKVKIVRRNLNYRELHQPWPLGQWLCCVSKV